MNGYNLLCLALSFSEKLQGLIQFQKSICCLLEDFFEDYIFAWGNKYLSFHNSSSFALRYFGTCTARPQCETHPLFMFAPVLGKYPVWQVRTAGSGSG